MPAPKTPPAPKTTQTKLAKLGLRSDMDLILHLPLRYEDETKIVPIREACLRGGHVSQVEGVVIKNEIALKPRRQLLVTIADDSGELLLRFMNFYGSQIKQLSEGVRVRARTEIKHGFFGAEMVHPTYKVVNENAPLPTSLTPVYPSGEGLSQPILRRAIAEAMRRVNWDDTVPPLIRRQMDLIDFEPAVKMLHYPPVDADEYALMEKSHPAWTRMKFDELLAQQLSLKRAQRARRDKGAPHLRAMGHMTEGLLAALPFSLTGAQQRVLHEIRADLREGYPMQRLLQGDVGSGKTVVAALAAAQAIDSGYQAALMAPTEILAEQHFRKIAAWMEPLGVKVAWLTGSLKKKDKLAANEMVESGEARLVIGTHALIQDTVQFAKLGLVIVDEQHRFGVGQRLTLRNKGSDGLVPHQLMMSATPIPRTLAMTYYADLEVSVIDELPPGRSPIVTRAIDQNRRDEVIERVHAAALEGRQVYWVCPLIEESEALQLQTATETYETLAEALPDLQVGLVHGRMKPAEKQAVMDAFTAAEVHVLVATTVIEVGRRRAECLTDGDRARRALRLVAAAPAARARGARLGGQRVPAAVSEPARAGGQAALADDARDDRRFRDRAQGPGDSRAGRVLGRAPVGTGDAALCRPGDRPVAGRARARYRGQFARRRGAGEYRDCRCAPGALAGWQGRVLEGVGATNGSPMVNVNRFPNGSLIDISRAPQGVSSIPGRA